MAGEAKEAVEETPDDFEAAWDEGGDEPTDIDADEETGAAESEDEADEVEEKDATETEEEPEAEKEAADDTSDEVEDDGSEDEDKIPSTPEEIKAAYEKLEQKHRTLQGMYNSEVRKKREDKPEPETPEPKEEVPEAKEDANELEDAILNELSALPSVQAAQKEFGDEMPKALADATKLILGKVDARINQLEGALAPVSETYTKISMDKHFAEIEAVHPDRQELVDSGAVRNWINSQPTYKQEMYRKVYEQGTSDELVDLFTTFKNESDYEPSAVPEKKAKAKSDKSKATDDALADQEAVPKRNSPTNPSGKGGASKDDFEGAWENF